MAYKVILPKKEKESFGGKLLRNATGGLVNFVENSESLLKNVAHSVADPLGLNQFKSKPRSVGVRDVAEQALGKEYLKPKGKVEEYGQHLVGTVPVAAALGGNGIISAAKNIVKSDIGRGAAQVLGLGETGQTIAGAIAPGVIDSLKNANIQKHFQPVKKELYKKVAAEGHNKIEAGEIKDLTHEFLEIEQRRSAGKSPFIRRLKNWNKEASNNEIKAEDIHNIKKDLNQYIYKEYNSPDYLKALEKETHKVIDAAGKNGQRTTENLTLPSWSKNLRKADKLHSILTEGDFNKSPEIVKWLFKKFTPGKFVAAAGKRFINPTRLWGNLPKETKDFYVDNILKGIEKNPGIFQPEIKKINQLVDKKEEKKEPKKGKFRVVL
jgi:hypothetical protein